ncbi:hypothetical protein ABIF65_001168 [Bradyrhizobium japonicum]|uniref:hypothetical protein n=1 Tax=Bradyrhizobium TaxID=374 RepID=UPI0012BD745A|nr:MULTISPECIES: hypothetical protein [Bradyrhizobium]MBR0884637.1 hypothetical protein [Bradyrhizobium liaoningense]MBR0998314.1 hypothetical protein [Bradyrhizobium liaoningense]MCP1739701.1 hypothetical protein [Bradyrhizobium japonicum]MCP1777886.1 hypothetical protein [Bradyrhizobium japonicum]MCP1857377.1 hypothetical protein [Bradyrhizobium japonicum]
MFLNKEKFPVEQHLRREHQVSRGLGRIQRECLRVIKSYEAAGERPTTFTVACEVYQVERDQDGNRWCNDAQHTATKRALANLRRKGLVCGQQEITVHADGQKIFKLAKSPPTDYRAERCCFWSLATGRDANDKLVDTSGDQATNVS